MSGGLGCVSVMFVLRAFAGLGRSSGNDGTQIFPLHYSIITGTVASAKATSLPITDDEKLTQIYSFTASSHASNSITTSKEVSVFQGDHFLQWQCIIITSTPCTFQVRCQLHHCIFRGDTDVLPLAIRFRTGSFSLTYFWVLFWLLMWRTGSTISTRHWSEKRAKKALGRKFATKSFPVIVRWWILFILKLNERGTRINLNNEYANESTIILGLEYRRLPSFPLFTSFITAALIEYSQLNLISCSLLAWDQNSSTRYDDKIVWSPMLTIRGVGSHREKVCTHNSLLTTPQWRHLHVEVKKRNEL